MKTILLLAFGLGLTACGGPGETAPPTVTPSKPVAKTCAAPTPGTFGAVALKNKTKRDIDLQATDDLLITAMSDTGCFTLIERDKIELLVNEMKLCDPTANPDSGYFDCPSFAQKGKLLGLTDLVVGDVVMLEPNVRGADLHAKLPWIGGLSVQQSYAAVAVSLRVLHVENGKIRASTNVSAVVPSTDAGLDVSTRAFDLGAAAHSHTPMGQALEAMITDGVTRLQGTVTPLETAN